MLYGDGLHDDTLAIQALLDQTGIVTLDKPGTYLISRTLIIHSNTSFILSPGAKLIAAPCPADLAEKYETWFVAGGMPATRRSPKPLL